MRLRALLVGALVVLTASACATIDTQPDQQGLDYNASGDITFSECVKPGQWSVYAPTDQTYTYPAGTRTYTFDDPGDRKPIEIADKDGQPLTVSGILTFSLTGDCKLLQQFHEQIGLKYGAADDGVGEWGDLLDDYLGQPLRAVMRDEAANYTWRELYTDPTKQDAFAEQVKKALPKAVTNLAGGDFFTHFTLLPQTPAPSSDLLNQIKQQNTQTERLNTIQAQKLAQDAEIAQMQQLVQLLGPDGYIAYKNQLACESGEGKCVPFLPLPQGANINVNPGG